MDIKCGIIVLMKLPDVDRIRSEKSLSFGDFVKLYNQDLPATFPPVSPALLREFKKTHASLFKSEAWSLDQHRKKVMDWLTMRRAQEMRAHDAIDTIS